VRLPPFSWTPVGWRTQGITCFCWISLFDDQHQCGSVSQPRDHASGGGDDLPSHVGRVIRTEEGGNTAHLVGFAEAIHGDLGKNGLGSLAVVPEQLAELGHDRARGQAVHTNVPGSQLMGQGLGQTNEGGLAHLEREDNIT